jgi:hypothetical protein
MDYVPKSHDIVRKIFETQSVTEILNGMLVNEKWKQWLSDKRIWNSLLKDKHLLKLVTDAYKTFINDDNFSTEKIDGIDWVSIFEKVYLEFQDIQTTFTKENPEIMFMFIWTMFPHVYLKKTPGIAGRYKLIKTDPTFFLSFPYEHSLFYRYSHTYGPSEVLWDHVIPEVSITNLKKRNIAYIHFDYQDGLRVKEIWKSNKEDRFPKLIVIPPDGKPMILAKNLKKYKDVTEFDAPCYLDFYIDYKDRSFPSMSFNLYNDVSSRNRITYNEKHVEYIIIITTYNGFFKRAPNVVRLLFRRVDEKGIMTYKDTTIPYFTHYEGEGERINTHMY